MRDVVDRKFKGASVRPRQRVVQRARPLALG
jgi:hypothetical protein